MAPHYEKCLGSRQLGVGAIDVQDPKVETGETVAARIREYGWLAPEQTIITSSCGLQSSASTGGIRKIAGDVASKTHPGRVGRDRAAGRI